MIIYTVSWHEKQIKSCKKQIDIQDYINCIHVDLSRDKTYVLKGTLRLKDNWYLPYQQNEQ